MRARQEVILWREETSKRVEQNQQVNHCAERAEPRGALRTEIIFCGHWRAGRLGGASGCLRAEDRRTETRDELVVALSDLEVNR